MSPLGFARRIPFRLLRRLTRVARAHVGAQVFRVPTHSDAAVSWIHWRRSWKCETLRVLLAGRDGAFVDVGANTGQTLADFLAAESPRAYLALEPNPASCAFLAEVAALNDLETVAIVPVAAAASTEVRALHVLAHDPIDATASLRADLRPGTHRRRVWVNTAPLDDLLRSTQTGAVSLVKIDVEGFELEVLRGASQLLRTQRPPLLCEVLLADHDAARTQHRERTEQLAELLRQHRYRIFQLVKTGAPTLPHLRALDRFPDGVWSVARAEECDFIFLPEETPPSGFHLLPA